MKGLSEYGPTVEADGPVTVGAHLSPRNPVLPGTVVVRKPVVQKLVVDAGGLRTSYLGPPESRRVH